MANRTAQFKFKYAFLRGKKNYIKTNYSISMKNAFSMDSESGIHSECRRFYF